MVTGVAGVGPRGQEHALDPEPPEPEPSQRSRQRKVRRKCKRQGALEHFTLTSQQAVVKRQRSVGNRDP